MKTKIVKSLSVFLAVVLMITAAPLSGFVGLDWEEFKVFNFEAQAAKSGYLTYTVSNGEATITDCDTSISGDFVIPDTLEGYPVTGIAYKAFYNCTGLTSITIPDSVTYIDRYAFSDCTGLTSVTIGNSVTSIGDYAFEDCSSLTSITVDTNNEYFSNDNCGVLFNKDKTILIEFPIGNTQTAYTIPNSVTSIGKAAFYDCSSLTSVTIPDSVTSIGDYAFYNCYSLTSITIPDSVTSIGGGTFWDCYSLTSITIGNNVTSIGSSAFGWCHKLTNIAIPDSVKSIGNEVFYACSSLTSITVDINNKYYSNDNFGVLFNKDKTMLIRYPIGNTRTKYVIPDSVTNIADGAFDGCSSLMSVIIPNGATSIGSGAFHNCSRLSNITIPNSVIVIVRSTFWGCSSLTSINIPDGMRCIPYQAFAECISLTSITIPNSVTHIIEAAFYKCKNLTTVYYAGTEEEWKEINVGRYNTNLTSANIIYNATPLMNSTKVENQKLTVSSNSNKMLKFTYKKKNKDTLDTVGDAVVKFFKGEEAIQSNRSYLLSDLGGNNLTFKLSDCKDYIITSEVYNTFKSPDEKSVILDGLNGATYEVPVNIYLEQRTDNDKAYISTVYGRLSDTEENKNREYINLADKKLEIDKNDKVDIIITSVGMTNPTYYISQDETHKVSSTTGKFSAASLYNEFLFNKDVYAYAIDSDGTKTKPVSINLVKKIQLSNAAQALADSTTYSFLGKSGIFGISISDDMPIFGGSKLDLSAFKAPIGVDIDDDNNVKISLGFDFFEKKYNYEKSEWETKSGWEAFKKSFKGVSETIKDTTKNYDDWYDNWYTLENLKKQYSGKNVFKTGDPSKDKGFNISFLGYLEGKVVNGDIVFKEGGAVIGGNFKYKYSQQVALWAVPGYYYFEASAGLKLSGEVARKIADSNLPIQLEATLSLEPGLAVGAGVGIVGFASAGLRGEGSLPVSYEFVKQHLNVKLKGAIKAEGQFFIFKGEKTLIDGETELIDKYFGIQKRRSAARINYNYLDELETQTKVSVLSRDYADETSEWLGADTDSKGKINVAETDGVNFTDLQTSVFEASDAKIVSFGDKKLMTWIEDDSSRDEYNRMRLVYSVYDGATWSQPKAVYDDGHNDVSPSLAFDGENVYVAWQKIKRNIVADDANNVDALTNEAEIYLAKYDEESDSFINVAALTDNEVYDYAPVVIGENGKAVVYFASGNPSNLLNNKIVRYNVHSATSKTVVDSLSYVSNIAAAFVDGVDEVSYSVDTDKDLSTTNDVAVFTARNGEITQFAMPEEHNSAVQIMTYGTLGDEKMLYTSDGSNVYYVKDGETKTAFSTVASIGGLKQCKVGENDALFWIGTTETGSELYYSILDGGTWSDPVMISDCETLITNVDIVSDGGKILGVCNRTEIITDDDGSTEKGQTDLCSFTFNDFDDVGVSIQSFDETKVVPGEKTTVPVLVMNNGTRKLEQVKFTVSDTLGTSESYVKDIEIAPGEIVSTDVDYTVPTDYASGKLTIKAETISGEDKNPDDNTASTDIGKCDITISEAEVSRVGDIFVVSAYIYNNSPISAKNVTLNAIAYDETNAPFSQTTIGEIKNGECNVARIEINANDVEFDENGTAKLYLKALTENDANDIDNNSSVILERGNETECGHPIWVESDETAPTCTESGRKTYTCSACGDNKYEEVSALGHDYSSDWTVDVDPTCTQDGSKSHHCTRCDEKSDVTAIAATGHTEVKDEAVNPTCTTAGKTEGKHCSACGEILEAQETVSATDHSYGSWTTTKKATCTAKGSKKRVCTECGYTQTQSVSALGHNYSSNWTTDKAATCSEAGSKSHHCTRCSAKTDVTAIAKTSHSYSSWTTTEKATCTAKGSKKKVCIECGYTVTQSISALGHKYSSKWTVDTEPTCTKTGSKSHHCTRCSAKSNITEIAATGHSYTSKVTKKATCTETGTRKYTCSNCKRTYTKTIAKISSVTLSATSYTYTGKAQTPTVTVKDSKGNTLKKGTDYTVKYSSGRKNVGKYTVTVTFKGNYSGKKTLTFKINPKGTTVSKLTAGTKKFTVKWNKQSTQTTGYQIRYSTSSKMTNAKTVTVSSASTTSKAISGLKSSTKYYVQIRTYKTVDSVKYYSSWSSAKSVKTK